MHKTAFKINPSLCCHEMALQENVEPMGEIDSV